MADSTSLALEALDGAFSEGIRALFVVMHREMIAARGNDERIAIRENFQRGLAGLKSHHAEARAMIEEADDAPTA
jgi:hypothetical protein